MNKSNYTEINFVNFLKLFYDNKIVVALILISFLLISLIIHSNLDDRYVAESQIYVKEIGLHTDRSSNELVALLRIHLFDYNNLKKVSSKYDTDNQLDLKKIHKNINVVLGKKIAKLTIKMESASPEIKNILNDLVIEANNSLKSDLIVYNYKNLEIKEQLQAELDNLMDDYESFRSKMVEGITYSDFIEKTTGDNSFLKPLDFMSSLKNHEYENIQRIYKLKTNIMLLESQNGECCILDNFESTRLINKKISRNLLILLSILTGIIISGFFIIFRLLFIIDQNINKKEI